jgi:glycosyltransferase involved in cell wall biosynthesis
MGLNPGQPLTVSLVTSVVVPRDAISNVCREQLEAVARYGRLHRRRVDVKVYACHAGVPDSRVVTTGDPAAVVSDEHFLASDLVLYQFGIYYPLFDSIHYAPRAARTVVTFYGITHPALLQEGVRDCMYHSYQQAANLHAADRILTTSRFLSGELERMGVPPAKVSPIFLPASFERLPDPGRKPPPGETLRLVYVGRFVSAKGVHDLLQALDTFVRRTGRAVQADLVGSATYSDRAYLEGLQGFLAARGLGAAVRFHFDIPDAELAELLLEADALVIPSYHEGFCVPVIEAMACGCFVIASDAGALPETSGGLGRLFRVGNAGELAGRLEEFAGARDRGGYVTESGYLDRAEWQARARAYTAGFSRARFQERFWDAVLGDLVQPDEEVRRGLVRGSRRVLDGLRAGPAAPAEFRSVYARVAEALATATPLAPLGRGVGGEGVGSESPLTPGPSPQRGEGSKRTPHPSSAQGECEQKAAG